MKQSKTERRVIETEIEGWWDTQSIEEGGRARRCETQNQVEGPGEKRGGQQGPRSPLM